MTDRGKEATHMSATLTALRALLVVVTVSMLACAVPLTALAANAGPGGP